MTHQTAEDAYYCCDRSEMLEYITGTPRTILEIGCGDGGVGAGLQARIDEVQNSYTEKNLRRVQAGHAVV